MTVKDTEWFKGKVSSFTNDDIPVMAEELRKLDREARKNLFAQVDFHGIIRALSVDFSNEGSEFYENFADLVRLLFEFKNPTDSFSEFNELFTKMVEHKDEHIRRAGVSLLFLIVDSGDFDCLLSAREYLRKIAKLAINPDLNIAAPGLSALTKLACKSAEGSRQVLLGPVAEVLKDNWNDESEIHHVRVYNLAVDAACASEESLKIVIDSRFLFLMQEWLESDQAQSDPLGLVNIIECFGKLCKCDWGYTYLANSGVLLKLEDCVVSDNLGQMQSVVMPELYEIFGNLCKNVPEKILHDCPRFVPHILKLVASASESPHIIRAEIAMIGQVATKPAGKIYLSQQHDELMPFFNFLKKCVHSGAQEDKMCVLDTSAALLFLKSDEQSDEFCRLTKSWFAEIVDSVRNLHEICSEPFVETAMPAIQLLLVVSQQPWGRRGIMETPGLLEWLLDREAACGVHKNSGSGGNPDVLRAKFDVAKVLNTSLDLSLAPELKNTLEDFVKQGPFFKRGHYEVATEAPGN